MPGFSSDFNFQIFKYFLVQLWILWSKFRLIGNICLVTECFVIKGAANLRFRHRSDEERGVNQALTDLNSPALLCCGWLYCSLRSLTIWFIILHRQKLIVFLCKELLQEALLKVCPKPLSYRKWLS